MNNQTNKSIEILKYAIENNINLTAASEKFGHKNNYVSGANRTLDLRLKNKSITKEEYNEFKKLYKEYQEKFKNKNTNKKNTVSFTTSDLENEPLTLSELQDIEYNADVDESYEDRSIGESIKDENGNITKYHYKIFIRDNPALEGYFTREEMDTVYRLYSSIDGAGLTLRVVSREFPNLTFRDFKRILRAFNITKQSIPVAPHILSEMTPDEIISIINHNKENIVLKRLEQERSKYIEKTLIEAQKKIIELQSNDDRIEKIIEKYFNKTSVIEIKPIKTNITSKSNKSKQGKPSLCIFGDIHYGKKYDSPVYGRGYNKDIAHERVLQIANTVIDDYKINNPSEIILICTGDLIENALEDGMHSGHHFEMDLFQEEQIFFAVNSLKEMLLKIINNVNCKISFHVVHGNHDRVGIERQNDKNRTAGKIISKILQRELECDRLIFNIPNNNLVRIVTGRLCLFLHHGDGSLSKKKPSELINLFGESGTYHILLKGHWHFIRTEEGTNFLSMTVPSVASTDKFIMEELGSNNLPGFIIGNEPENCYGFDYKKITLY